MMPFHSVVKLNTSNAGSTSYCEKSEVTEVISPDAFVVPRMVGESWLVVLSRQNQLSVELSLPTSVESGHLAVAERLTISLGVCDIAWPDRSTKAKTPGMFTMPLNLVYSVSM